MAKKARLPGIALVAATALALTIAACSSSTSATSASGGSGASGGSVRGSTLVVYSPQGADTRGPYISAQAKKDLGITVKFVAGAGGDLTNRLLAERNNPQADVVLGLGEAQMDQVDQAGILQPYTPSWAGQIPSAYRGGSKDFTLFTQTPIVMAYNPAKISAASAPKTWTDLAEPQYKDKFTFPSTTSQTGQAAVVGILWQFTNHATGQVSPQGWDTLNKILANSYQVSSGQAFDWKWVADGQQPVAVNWLGGLQTGEQDNNLHLTLINPPTGSPYVQTGIGLVKGTKNAAAAKAFINWFGSASFQVGFVKATNNDTPVNTAAVKQLGPQAAQLAQVSKESIDWGVVTKQLSGWLQKIQLGTTG